VATNSNITVPNGSRVVVVVSLGPPDQDETGAICNGIIMPDVLGKSQGAALELVARGGLRPRVIYDYNATVRKGSVMAQHPAGGMEVPAKAETLLLVSSGPAINDRVAVDLPNVVGLSEEDALGRLRLAGLSPKVVHEKNFEVPDGIVAAQTPDKDSLVTKPKANPWIVWLIIALLLALLALVGLPMLNRGKEQTGIEQPVTQIKVPDVVGLSLSDATKAIEDANLQVGTTEVVDSTDGQPGAVLSSTPKAGQALAEGSPISLEIVSAAPLVVPDVSGKTQAEASEAITAAGLSPSPVSSPSKNVKKGQVIAQSPAADQHATPGSMVVVLVSGGKPADKETVRVPKVVGLPVADATKKLTDLGLAVKINPADAVGEVTALVSVGGKTVPKGSVIILEVK
jgi:beta-lactam-binding protein with PASTA domain